MVEVGDKCNECKYYSKRSGTCDFYLLTGQSRTVTNNIRIDPHFCDKFVKGERNIKQERDTWIKEIFR